jgi:hypothetical protein
MWAWLSFPIGVEVPTIGLGFHMIRRAYPRRPLSGALAAHQRLKLWDDRTGETALCGATEGGVHPTGAGMNGPCLRSHHDHVQGEHPLSRC